MNERICNLSQERADLNARDYFNRYRIGDVAHLVIYVSPTGSMTNPALYLRGETGDDLLLCDDSESVPVGNNERVRDIADEWLEATA